MDFLYEDEHLLGICDLNVFLCDLLSHRHRLYRTGTGNPRLILDNFMASNIFLNFFKKIRYIKNVRLY